MGAIRSPHRPATTRLIQRRQTSAEQLDVCVSQVVKWEQAGIITAIRVPGVRTVWNDAAEIQRLAENIRRGKLSNEPIDADSKQSASNERSKANR